MNKMTFQIDKLNQSRRVYRINLTKINIDEYLNKVKAMSVRDMENIPLYRFLVARDFESIFQIKKTLLQIINDYETGAVLINCNDINEISLIKISTAIAYLLGTPSIDPLSGKYYAIFTIQHGDGQVPELFRPYEQFKMHTDGAYMKKAPDWIFFMKTHENQSAGGQSKLLHINDWDGFFDFYRSKLNVEFKFFENPEPKGSEVRYDCDNDIGSITAKLLNLKAHRKTIRFVDRFIYPNSIDEAEYVYQFQQSLENCTKIVTVNIPVGSILLINNHFWLHGRAPFEQNTHLSRSLMRQRGYLR